MREKFTKLVISLKVLPHIGCLNPWSAAYIPVGQLYLMLIDFKMKSNVDPRPRLSFRCDEHLI